MAERTTEELATMLERIADEYDRTSLKYLTPPGQEKMREGAARLRRLQAVVDRCREAGELTGDDVPVNDVDEVWFWSNGELIAAEVEGGAGAMMDIHYRSPEGYHRYVALPALACYSTEQAARAAAEAGKGGE